MLMRNQFAHFVIITVVVLIHISHGRIRDRTTERSMDRWLIAANLIILFNIRHEQRMERMGQSTSSASVTEYLNCDLLCWHSKCLKLINNYCVDFRHYR